MCLVGGLQLGNMAVSLYSHFWINEKRLGALSNDISQEQLLFTLANPALDLFSKHLYQ